MSRQIERAKAVLSRAIRKNPKHRPLDKPWSSKVLHPRSLTVGDATVKQLTDAIIEKSIVKAVTPKQLKKQINQIQKDYEKAWIQKQKERKEHQLEAEKNQKRQHSPFYQICLGGAYGVFGSFYGATGQSQTGLKYAQELKKYDVATLQDAIRRLRNRDLKGYPLASYDSNYIERVINYLLAEIQTRQPEIQPSEDGVTTLRKALNLFRGN